LFRTESQSVLWLCETTQDIEPNQVILKSYKSLSGRNLTEIEIKDLKLSELGLRNQVYQFYDFGKIEKYISNKIDFEDDNGNSIGQHSVCAAGLIDISDLNLSEVYLTVARNLGRLHLAEINGIDKTKYRDAEFGQQNTYHVKEHFNQLEQLAEHLIQNQLINYTSYDSLKNEMELELVISDFGEEIDFVFDQVQNYYSQNPEDPVFCHNDLNGGNILRNVLGDFNSSSVEFIEFDQSSYGFRAFDIVYHFDKWPIYPTTAQKAEFVQAYAASYYGDDINDSKIEIILKEIEVHESYVLLEQMLFSKATGGDIRANSIQAYTNAKQTATEEDVFDPNSIFRNSQAGIYNSIYLLYLLINI